MILKYPSFHALCFRPFALKIDCEQLDFEQCFAALERELDKLPWSGDRSQQPLFYTPNKSAIPGDNMFHNTPLGRNNFDQLVRHAGWAAGLDLRPLQRHNQSLRVTVFDMHKALGIAPDATTSVVGHSSTKTQMIYQRNRIQQTGVVNASIQSNLTGQNILFTEDTGVKLLNGKTVQVATPQKQLPLCTMSLDDYFDLIPTDG